MLDHPHLQVLGAPLQQVFVMKLYAGRSLDFDDLVALWPRCSFVGPEDAADLFHQAYPHLEPDPFLRDYVRHIASLSDR